jgi:hypothetical protein
MSGTNESSVAEKSQQLDDILEKYERSCGIPKIQIHSEAEQYLNMNHQSLAKLTAEQCGEAAVTLAQFGFHIQRCYNAEMARANWAEDIIKRTIASEVGQYKAASFEERKLQAIRGNDYADKLDKLRLAAKARADKLSYIGARIEFLAKTMLELQQTKRRQYN